jgi:hypothetical protein
MRLIKNKNYNWINYFFYFYTFENAMTSPSLFMPANFEDI